MLRQARLLWILLPWAAFGCSPQPCKECIDVSGTFLETTQPRTVDCKDGHYLLSGGGQGHVTVRQSGSDIAIDELGLAGILHEDKSLLLGPVPATAQPVNGVGEPDPSGHPEPGKLYLTGWFTGIGDTAGFQGTYVFLQDVDGCEIDEPVKWYRDH